ncbi:MAG: hypothetical protein K5776_03110 [Lachnospiraceae bacterium]|nr:hypothetical protein [Lachnospiraceae bacterium]
MKLINKRNFISIVCIFFTLITCGKLLLERAYNFTDKYYTDNIFTILAFSVLITVILSLHFYLQKFPFWLVFIGQYALTVGIVFLAIFIHGRLSTNAPTAYWDMFKSITIPFFIGAVVYYICFFVQIKRANKVLEKLNSNEE